MPLLTLILSYPLIFLAYNKNHEAEKFYFLKLSLVWLGCQIYIYLNSKVRVPVGMIIAGIVIYYTKTNKLSKLLTLGIGITSFLLSCFVYLLYK